jgi:hypothetical protein
MSAEHKLDILENGSGKFEVQFLDGSKVGCQNRGDAELVLDAVRRFYEGNTNRRLPRRTLAALERAGVARSLLFRSAMRNLEEDDQVGVNWSTE